MMKRASSFVLASFSGSTYFPVRLDASFAAASLDGPFDHPFHLKKEGTLGRVLGPHTSSLTLHGRNG
jgi:hypothetical protein